MAYLKHSLAALILLVVPGIAGAQVAKWDDYLERGRAFERQRHYADAEALYITIVIYHDCPRCRRDEIGGRARCLGANRAGQRL